MATRPRIEHTLSSLFTANSNDPILESILGYLPWQEIVRSNLISRHVRELNVSSSRLQLAWRCHHHDTRPPPTTSSSSAGQQLHDLVTLDENLRRLRPVDVRTLKQDRDYKNAQMSGEWLLLPERCRSNGDKPGVVKGFSLWDLSTKHDSDNTQRVDDDEDDDDEDDHDDDDDEEHDDDDEHYEHDDDDDEHDDVDEHDDDDDDEDEDEGDDDEGDDKRESAMLFRVEWDEQIIAIAFSVEDNLLVIVTRMPFNEYVDSRQLAIYQVSFYRLDGGCDTSGHGDRHWEQITHPKAAIAKINIGARDVHNDIVVHLAGGGSGNMIIGMFTLHGHWWYGTWIAWDWKEGRCLGMFRYSMPNSHASAFTACFLDTTHVIFVPPLRGFGNLHPTSLCVSQLPPISRTHISHDYLSFSSTTGDPIVGQLISTISHLPVKTEFNLGSLAQFYDFGEYEHGPMTSLKASFNVKTFTLSSTQAIPGSSGGIISLQMTGKIAPSVLETGWDASCQLMIPRIDILRATRGRKKSYEPEEWFGGVGVQFIEAPNWTFRIHGSRTITLLPNEREKWDEQDAIDDRGRWGTRTVILSDYSPYSWMDKVRRVSPTSSFNLNDSANPIGLTPKTDANLSCLHHVRTFSRDPQYRSYVCSSGRARSNGRPRTAVEADLDLEGEEEIKDILFDGKRLVLCLAESVKVLSFA